MKRFLTLNVVVSLIIVGCQSNPVIFKAFPTDNLESLKITHLDEFKPIKDQNIKYLNNTEVYNAFAVDYKIGKTLGFVNSYYLKTMIKSYKSSIDGSNRIDVTVRSYNTKDQLQDELIIARTDNDTVFAGYVHKDLIIKTQINDTEQYYELTKNGSFKSIN